MADLRAALALRERELKAALTELHEIRSAVAVSPDASTASVLQLLIRGAKLTQEQVAEAANISAKHLSQIITGHTSMSAAVAVQVAAVVGVPAELLLAEQAHREVAALGGTQPALPAGGGCRRCDRE